MRLTAQDLRELNILKYYRLTRKWACKTYSILLTVTENKQKEVIHDITAAINSARNIDKTMIVVSDDSNSVFASPFITGCANTITAEA